LYYYVWCLPRGEFLKIMTEVERRGRTYNGVNMEVETMPVFAPG
jgi:hypothetical protein